MERACITRIIPVSDQILLLIFKNSETETYDAKYILHQLPGIYPRSDPENFKSFICQNSHIVQEWASNIDCSSPHSEEDMVEVTLSFEEDQLREVEETCAELKITVDQLAIALARFIVEPNTKDALAQWYDQIVSEEK